MSKRRKHDTDTLTRIDQSLFEETTFDAGPEAPTTKQPGAPRGAADPDAETHRLDARVWAPMRVCPQCSLAWEVTGEWCPSCGTPFNKASRATRVQPAAQVVRRNQPPRSGSSRRPAAQRGAPARQTPAPRKKSNGAGKIIFTVLLFVTAIVVAFLVGQSTRPSSAEVDRNTAEAVQTARRSAANSYSRAFEKIQAEAAAALEAAQKRARAQGLAQGEANAQAQREQDSQSIFDKVTGCVLSGNCGGN
jgi:hypothetical protein